MQVPVSYSRGTPERATIRELKKYGFLVLSVVGTNNHILYFAMAPFGRACMIIEDGTPSEVNATAVNGDINTEDPHLSIVEGQIVALTYPAADYVTYYTTEVEVEDGTYYIVELNSILEDPEATSVQIDDYFTTKSQQFFQDKMSTVADANEFVTKINNAKSEAASLSSKIAKGYEDMHKLRNQSIALIREGNYAETIELGSQLRELLASTEQAAHSYHVLAEKMIRF